MREYKYHLFYSDQIDPIRALEKKNDSKLPYLKIKTFLFL